MSGAAYMAWARQPYQWAGTRQRGLEAVPAKVNKQQGGSNRAATKAANEESTPYAFLGERKYRVGDKQWLFIICKTGVDTPGSGRGWVYGAAMLDGKAVS